MVSWHVTASNDIHAGKIAGVLVSVTGADCQIFIEYDFSLEYFRRKRNFTLSNVEALTNP